MKTYYGKCNCCILQTFGFYYFFLDLADNRKFFKFYCDDCNEPPRPKGRGF